MNPKARLSFLAVLLIFTLAASSGGDVSVFVSVHLTGCAAVDRSEHQSISLQREEEYPGDGLTITPTRWVNSRPELKVGAGYWRLELASEHCWESFTPFVVVAGHDRHLVLEPPTWVRKPSVDYDIYTIPYGALVGDLGIGGSRSAELRALSAGGFSKRYRASLEGDGMYYFDQVTVGDYELEISVNGFKHSQQVHIKEHGVAYARP